MAKYSLTLTYVDDVATVKINGKAINIAAFRSPKRYEKDISSLVKSGVNIVTVVAQNRAKEGGCAGSVKKSGRILFSWHAVLQAGEVATGPFLEQSCKFLA